LSHDNSEECSHEAGDVMIVVIDTARRTVQIEETSVLTALVVRSSSPDTSAAGEALGKAGLGFLSGQYAWLAIEALRALCGDQNDEWEAAFRAMVDYAADHGWVDADRAHVRAHLDSAT
jgi:hypothetical protein